MHYAIYPPIGIARIGNSSEYFIGPEQPGSLGVEFSGNAEVPVTAFKDAQFRMKRQGARFRIFKVEDDGTVGLLPDGATVRWTVKLANRKDAILRPGSPPNVPARVRDDPARQDRAITAEGNVVGANQGLVTLTGSYRGQPVKLGDLLTDVNQHLVVLGGSGRAASLSVPPAPMGGSFYSNPDWFDDVADGSIAAVVEIPGQAPVQALPAWVITAPPDFAPPALGVVTLFDVIKQVAITKGWITSGPRPSFPTDIRPMIERASGLRLVDQGEAWPLISRDWVALADASAAGAQLRAQTAALVREVENALHDFALQDWQSAALDAWVAGTFDDAPRPDRGMCDVLTRSALDATVGQGFYPGIEAGVNVTDPNLYLHSPFEFRFAPTLRPGDGTAHMAQPWQADFLKCAGGWWPAQRPDILPIEAGPSLAWLRPGMNHVRLVADVMKLGVATPTAEGGVVERGRDPAL